MGVMAACANYQSETSSEEIPGQNPLWKLAACRNKLLCAVTRYLLLLLVPPCYLTSAVPSHHCLSV